jgi:predicted AlkP superfamily phosphohydrolase/phosphomutase
MKASGWIKKYSQSVHEKDVRLTSVFCKAGGYGEIVEWNDYGIIRLYDNETGKHIRLTMDKKDIERMIETLKEGLDKINGINE